MDRIQKIIAQNSDYSRRAAEELITQGRVQLNGTTVTELGTKAGEKDIITIDGNSLVEQDKVYYLLNKPTGYICSRNDNFDRPIVIDLIDDKQKIYPVGRLDYATSGLLLMTNDGALANGLMHPRYKIPKTYLATISGQYNEQQLDRLRTGIEIDGVKTLPAIVKNLGYNVKTNKGHVEVTIYEGKNLQVRKMFEAIDTTVLRLKRTKYAFFDLDQEKLPQGGYRRLKIKEIQRLYSLFSLKK